MNVVFYGRYSDSGQSEQSIESQRKVTFAQTQLLLEKNRKAPARAKAIDEHYLPTTKIFCGHCDCAITGVSGTSSTNTTTA